MDSIACDDPIDVGIETTLPDDLGDQGETGGWELHGLGLSIISRLFLSDLSRRRNNKGVRKIDGVGNSEWIQSLMVDSVAQSHRRTARSRSAHKTAGVEIRDPD